MEPAISVVALLLAGTGLAATILKTISAAVRHKGSLMRKPDGTIDIHVDGKVYTIDMSAVEKEDPRKIDRAIRHAKANKSKELAV